MHVSSRAGLGAWHQRVALISVAALATVLWGGTAHAQYRPPPKTEQERLADEGDDLRAEAGNLLARGNRDQAVNKLKRAVESYQKALALDPDLVVAAKGLGAAGVALADKAAYTSVVNLVTPVAQNHPDEPDLAYNLGLALYKLGREDEAAPLFEKISPLKNPDQLLAHYYLAQHYLHQGRGAPASAELNRYLELRPAQLASKDSEIFQLLGSAYLQVHRPDYARISYERAQRGLAKESLPVQMGLAACLEMENKPNDAAVLLSGLITRFADRPEPRERLGRILLAQNDLKRADDVAQQLVRVAPNLSNGYLLLGDVKIAEKQAAAAEGALRKAVQLAPGTLAPQLSLAKALQAGGKSDEAIALLENAAKNGADTVDVWAALGSVNRRAGHIQRALEMHARVIQLAPQLAIGHVLTAADYFATGQWDQAITHYETALKLEPSEFRARHWLALALQHRARQRADANRLDEAVPDLRRAFDLERTAQVARNLGAVQFAQKSYKDARLTLEQAVTLADAGWQDHQMLGYARLGQHDAPAAVASFEKALTLTQDLEQQAQIYAGWALAKLEAGEFDAAVAKLNEPGVSKSAAKVVQANLPLALVQRSLDEAFKGDATAAAKDLEAARSMTNVRQTEVAQLSQFARAMVDVEEGKTAEATSNLRRSLSGGARWIRPNGLGLAQAYVSYRAGRFGEARKQLAPVMKKGDLKQQTVATELTHATFRREGEKAYLGGSMGTAEKAFKSSLATNAHDPFVLHDLACIRYRKGGAGAKDAAATWTQLADTVPEASLNLGIMAQEKEKDPKRAVSLYRRYLASASGPRATLVREWRDRLQSIYGVVDDVPPSGTPGEHTTPSSATADGDLK